MEIQPVDSRGTMLYCSEWASSRETPEARRGNPDCRTNWNWKEGEIHLFLFFLAQRAKSCLCYLKELFSARRWLLLFSPLGGLLALLVVKKQTESDSVLEPSDAAAINGTLRTSAGPDSIRTDLIMFGQLFALGDKSRVCRSRSQLFYVEPIIESHCEWSSRQGGHAGRPLARWRRLFVRPSLLWITAQAELAAPRLTQPQPGPLKRRE